MEIFRKRFSTVRVGHLLSRMKCSKTVRISQVDYEYPRGQNGESVLAPDVFHLHGQTEPTPIDRETVNLKRPAGSTNRHTQNAQKCTEG